MQGLVTAVLAQTATGNPFRYQVYIGDGFEEWSADVVRANVVELDNPAIANSIMNLSHARAGLRKVKVYPGFVSTRLHDMA